ncbi:histidine kinase dimerization/phospho-acceptor domain-containing protein, partial [Stenotrophomonas maltophilia]|uniref:histidine kinase dimerization/phospho-acceptor domain-containing protein n=1 Tax=Stenotrophomonas maltophilia TaxID=40324 RepID=UPI001952C325
SSFLAAMTHEIRTPLNVILGNLELLERSALDASQHGRVQTLRTAARTASSSCRTSCRRAVTSATATISTSIS